MALFTACSRDETTPVVPVGVQTVKNLAADPTTGANPATGQPLGTTGKFALFRLAESKTVANTNSATARWDISFRGTTIIVDGGAIRTGKGGAYVQIGTFDELTTVPTSASFVQDQSTTNLVITTASGKDWCNYNAVANVISPIPGRVLLIHTADGKFAKLEILSYHENTPTTVGPNRDRQHYFTFQYVHQSDGSIKLN